jgi:hypothetical protein
MPGTSARAASGAARQRSGTAPDGDLGDRLGQRGAPALLEHRDERLLVEAEAAELLRRHDPEEPGVCEHPRERVRAAALRRPRCAHRRRRTPALEQRARPCLERAHVRVEGEVHPRYLRGSPSNRSAMTLRWISFVPA